jgi:hypothetical protein
VLRALAVSDGQVDASADEITDLLGETAEPASTDATEDDGFQEALALMEADIKAADQA